MKEFSILEYRGRVPQRSGSLQKRNHILQSTLDIIYTEGLRGVRHRAVAELAQVPLSATTYYFKDIDELIVDSFVFFMEKNIQHQQAVFEHLLSLLADNQSTKLDQQQVTHFISEQFVAYIEQQTADKTSRVIESEFIQYATRVPALAKKVAKIHQYFEDRILQVLDSLQVTDSEFKAKFILAFIRDIEGRALLCANLDKEQLTSDVKQLLKMLLS